MPAQEFVLQEHVRGDCYRLLAACFYYPQKETFIQESVFKNLTDAFKRVCPPAAIFSENMGEAISLYSNEELLIDYSQLFVGPQELIAPPYGSVYLDKERKVMGNSTIAVREMYRESGLAMSGDFRELPDHIAAELEFMYFLIIKETEALEKAATDSALHFVEMQRLFTDKFLGQWVGLFCRKIKEGTDNAFYRALADCVSTFVGNCSIPDNIQGKMNREAEGMSGSA